MKEGEISGEGEVVESWGSGKWCEEGEGLWRAGGVEAVRGGGGWRERPEEQNISRRFIRIFIHSVVLQVDMLVFVSTGQTVWRLCVYSSMMTQ